MCILDLGSWSDTNVPGASYFGSSRTLAKFGSEEQTINSDYFWYHHSHADQMNVFTVEELDRAAATWAALAYTLAELDEMLPRE